jgi:hypothetical protein
VVLELGCEAFDGDIEEFRYISQEGLTDGSLAREHDDLSVSCKATLHLPPPDMLPPVFDPVQ